jgi:hypothetical protein
VVTENKAKKQRSSQSTPTHYVLRVELIGIQPAIWRRLHVDGRTRLNALHHILQATMGWSDTHLHTFEIHNSRYGVSDPEFGDPGWEVLDEQKYRLNQLLAEGDTCDYLYDFGDSWSHQITVEEIKDAKATPIDGGFAWVEMGARACPPDDAGGSGGYQDFLDRLENDPYGDETNALREWAGLDFDPERFDRQAANASIARMLCNRWIKIGH